MFLEAQFDAPLAPAPAPAPDIEQKLGRYVRAARGGFSRNTERADQVRPRHLCRVV